jgi:hypothetical protein
LHKEVANSGLLRESILALHQKARRDYENPKRKQGRIEISEAIKMKMGQNQYRKECNFVLKLRKNLRVSKKEKREFVFLMYLEGTSSIHEYPSLERGGIQG